MCNAPGFRHAIEQAKAFGLEGVRNIVGEEECEDIVFEKIADRAGQAQRRQFYGEQELLIHKRMWNVLKRDKDGVLSFTQWCRKVADHRERSTTGRWRPVADRNTS